MAVQRLVRIRDVKSNDMQAILTIEYKCFKDPYPLSLLNRLHAMHPDGFLVAEAEDKIVGYVIGVLRWGATGHILAIATDPPYQRQGIASALMEHIINRLRANGAKLVRLEVRKSNAGAQQFYLKLGFRQQGEVPYYYEDGEAAMTMDYKLD
ncbi:MAG: ribosomal protein S18-alanine N-acetyltransferase [Hadesarchaea archaeon]|nr:ribosomal protein S18-alanine N-acetyltransferase [Hadesarchaea archaeon]